MSSAVPVTQEEIDDAKNDPMLEINLFEKAWKESGLDWRIRKQSVDYNTDQITFSKCNPTKDGYEDTDTKEIIELNKEE